MIAFESFAKPLLFVHLVLAVIALAAGIHCLIRLVQLHRRGFPTMYPIVVHARTMAVAYGAAMVLGVLIYPTFRVRVRAEFMDSVHPFAVSLFEMKEHASLLALPLAGWVWYLARTTDLRQPDGRAWLPALYGGVGYVSSTIVYSAWCGWYLSSLRSL